MSLTLLDWRRQVAALYGEVRATSPHDPEGALIRFRQVRDVLFRDHAQSPVPADRRHDFAGLRYWPYAPALRFEAQVRAAPAKRLVVTSLTGETFPLERIGRVQLPVGRLDVFWISVYGGGLFIPFRDTTSGRHSYGGGRYLLDTVKGADLGGGEGRLVIDFNYAYQPSCAYDPRWSCPLAPRSNWLVVPIEAGERWVAPEP